MAYQFISVTRTNGIATITINRPEKRNALHQPMVKELLNILQALSQDASQVIIFRGEGKNFCAGADLDWMKQISLSSTDENYADAQYLADLLYTLYHFPKPTIVLAHGAILGGGLGIVAAADIAIAAKNAVFGFPEVKVGLVPSIISPYIVSIMGERFAQYYFLTGLQFGAEEAYRVRLVQQIANDDALESVGFSIAQTLLKNSPKALKAVKELIHYVSNVKITESLVQKTAEHLAHLRQTAEAQEGMMAFLEKRIPHWQSNTNGISQPGKNS